MAEEISQEELVKRQQIAIAKSMHIKQDVLNMMDMIQDWHVREWVYICALDGMPAEQLDKLLKQPASVSQIRKIRQDYLQDQLSATDTLQRDMERLKKEVKEAYQESREARSAIEKGLEDALKNQARAQAETIQAKDDIIGMLRKELTEQKKKSIPYPPKTIQIEELESDIQFGSEEEILQQNSKPRTDPMANCAVNAIKNKKTWPFGLIRQNAETKHFIERYIKDEQMSKEQIDFLLDCLEEGLSIKEIEKFAIPGLTVEMMDRLKKLQMKG